MIKWSFLIFSGLCLASLSHSIELGPEDFKVSGYVDGGRYWLRDTTVNGEVISRMGARWNIDKEINENWSIMANPHWMFWRNQATDISLAHVAGIKFDADLQGVIKYKSGANRAKLGLYEFKYNPDSKNLGEYLLRSSAYPTLVENSQGKDLLSYSNNKVMGTEYGQDFDYFRHTSLIYLEQTYSPVNDVSMAFLGAVGPRKAELELGVSYFRFLKTGSPTKIDTLRVTRQMRDYIKSQGLETKAVKLTLRGRLDLAEMLGMNDSFKVYGEVALLGLKNDSLFYKNMKERVPMMAGIDIPTFGLLDVLSFEAEYFTNPYEDKKYPMADINGSKFSPLPYLPSFSDRPNFTDDDFKWSVFLHKSLNSWIDFKMRAASDHLRLLDWDGDVRPLPLTQRPQDWYLLARLEFHN